MKRRINRIEILLTDDELAGLKSKAASFGSLSFYIRSALKEFSDPDARTTFIVDPELIRKVKYISLVESSLLKDVISEALTSYIEAWESENGKIRLHKKQ